MADTDRDGDRGTHRTARRWGPADDDARRTRNAAPSNGLRGFLRKLAALFSLDPRSSGR